MSSKQPINRIGIKGRVVKTGVKKQGESWTLHEVAVDGVKDAGKKNEDGIVVYSTFDLDGVKEGQVIGQVCRANGYRFNRDGKVGYGCGLTAVGKPTIIEDAPSDVAPKQAAEATAEEEEEFAAW